MNALIIGLYGLFFVMVGFAGNTSKLSDYAKSDMGGFLSWAVSIGVLAVAYEYEFTRKLAQPFIFLLVLSFILINWDNLNAEFNRLKSM